MSSRTLLLDAPFRNISICQSCLRNLRRGPPQTQRWFHAKSQAGARSRLSPPTSQGARPRTRPTKQQFPEPPPNLFPGLRDTGDESHFRFFEEEGSGNLRQLPGADQWAASLGDDIDIQRLFREAIREVIGDLKSKNDSTRLDDPDAIAEKLERLASGVKDAKSLHKQLDGLKQGVREELEQLDEPLRTLDNDTLEKLNLDPEALRQVQESRALRKSPIPQIPEQAWTWTKSQRRQIAQLNLVLERLTRVLRIGDKVTQKNIAKAWKSYSQARGVLALSWASIPVDVWQLLWRIFERESREDPNRLSHVALLARDMSSANVTLNHSQQLLTIEAMFMEGWKKNAVDSWKRCVTTLGDEQADTFKEYWELGARMFCRQQRLDEASRAIDKLLARQSDPRILFPFIRSCTEIGSEASQTRGWEAYRQMRQLLGESMVIEDYDKVISLFLGSNQANNALYAFVDMMTAGRIDLKGKQHLPSVISNKFFFGKWLKRLIGAGDLDGAHKVVNFMQAKGIEASPMHVNGLIGAWQRSGGADDLKKAEDIAWKMIQSRIGFVRARKRNLGPKAKIALVDLETPASQASLPRATSETFCILAEGYRVRGLHGRLLELWDASQDAEISPDAFMMNQLLESYAQDGNTAEARRLYNALVHEHDVEPDPYTFMALWKMLGSNRMNVIVPEVVQDERRAARQVFAEMIRFKSVFEPDGMDGQLARKILHTLRRLQDDIAIVLAVRVLRDVFKFLPTEALVLEMILNTTNLSLETPRSRQKLRVAKLQLDVDIGARQQRLGNGAVLLEEMTPERRAEELYLFLQRRYLPESLAEEHVMAELQAAAREMGVYDIVKDELHRSISQRDE